MMSALEDINSVVRCIDSVRLVILNRLIGAAEGAGRQSHRKIAIRRRKRLISTIGERRRRLLATSCGRSSAL